MIMKPRPSYCFEAAIEEIISHFSASVLATLLGKSRPLVYKWGDSDTENLPNLSQSLAMDIAHAKENDGEAPILAMYNKMFELAIGIPVSNEDLWTTFAKVVKEGGDVGGKLQEVFADGKMTPREREELLKECKEAIAALGKMVKVIQSQAKSLAGRDKGASNV